MRKREALNMCYIFFYKENVWKGAYYDPKDIGKYNLLNLYIIVVLLFRIKAYINIYLVSK